MRCSTLAAMLAAMSLSHAAAEYVPAEPVDRRAPQYPGEALQLGLEGWVQLSYVVEADGSVSGVLVEDSSDRVFEEPSRRALSRFRYRPATLNGVPVASGRLPFRMRYALDPAPRGVSGWFHSRANRFQRLLDGGDLTGAAGVLQDIESRRRRSLSEDAWLSWLRAAYHRAANDADARHFHLLRAVGPYDDNLLNRDVYPVALGMLYASHVERGELPSALRVWTRMHEAGGEPARLAELLRDHADSLQQLLVDMPVLRSSGRLNGDYAWSRELTRRSFELDVEQGHIEALSLRCERRIETLAYSADAAWTVPEAWGDCRLFVTGESGTSFTVLEYAD